MKTIPSGLAAVLVLAVVAPSGAVTAAAPATAAAQSRQYEGTIVSVRKSDRTFRLRDSERGTIRIKVTRNTRFERLNGFAALRAGLTNIEAVVRRSGGRFIASEVERSGGGGEHGGGNDDDGNDDNGGRGRGGDD
jgi:hypothetical protein